MDIVSLPRLRPHQVPSDKTDTMATWNNRRRKHRKAAALLIDSRPTASLARPPSRWTGLVLGFFRPSAFQQVWLRRCGTHLQRGGGACGPGPVYLFVALALGATLCTCSCCSVPFFFPFTFSLPAAPGVHCHCSRV